MNKKMPLLWIVWNAITWIKKIVNKRFMLKVTIFNYSNQRCTRKKDYRNIT